MKHDAMRKAAVGILTKELYLPLFKKKLASYGIHVKNDEELMKYCMMAWHLRNQIQKQFGFVDLQPDPIEKAAAKLVAKENPHIVRAAKIILSLGRRNNERKT